jgi:hypothetical protein
MFIPAEKQINQGVHLNLFELTPYIIYMYHIILVVSSKQTGCLESLYKIASKGF